MGMGQVSSCLKFEKGKRYTRVFNEKIKNALDLNASGILVYDNEEGKPLQSMKGNKSFVSL